VSAVQPEARYRVVANVQDTKSYLPARETLRPRDALTWKISAKAHSTFKYLVSTGRRKARSAARTCWASPSLPHAAGRLATLHHVAAEHRLSRPHGANGEPTGATRKDRVNMLQAALTTSLGDHVSMRLPGSWF